MKKKNESRRSFLKGAAAGASAGAVAAFIPKVDAQSGNDAETATEPFSVDARHGAFFNREQAAAIAAFVERLMPGHPASLGRRMRTCSTTLISRSPGPMPTNSDSTAAV